MQVSLQQAAMPTKAVAAVSKLQQMIAKGKVLDGASGHALAVLASLRIAVIALPLKLATNPVTLERLKKRMPVLPELRMRSVSQLVAVALAAILVIRARPAPGGRPKPPFCKDGRCPNTGSTLSIRFGQG